MLVILIEEKTINTIRLQKYTQCNIVNGQNIFFSSFFPFLKWLYTVLFGVLKKLRKCIILLQHAIPFDVIYKPIVYNY